MKFVCLFKFDFLFDLELFREWIRKDEVRWVYEEDKIVIIWLCLVIVWRVLFIVLFLSQKAQNNNNTNSM